MHVVFNEYEWFDIRTSIVYYLGQVYFLSLLFLIYYHVCIIEIVVLLR